MDYADMLRDIAIARRAIDESRLDMVASNKRLLCEVYCLTSFSDQTFYLQIYDGDKYILLYSKPYLHTPYGISSVSGSFSAISEADRHIAYRGDIYCGLKYLPKDDAIIDRLISCLPTETEVIAGSGIVLDGITTLVISHITETPNILYFRNEAKFKLNGYSPEDTRFLHDLYLHIEGIIGNLHERCK